MTNKQVKFNNCFPSDALLRQLLRSRTVLLGLPLCGLASTRLLRHLLVCVSTKSVKPGFHHAPIFSD